jgi:hypothetical protein
VPLFDESNNLHRCCPKTIFDAQLQTTFTAFSGTLRFPFESRDVFFTTHPVFQSAVRSEDRENSFNTWLAVHLTHAHASGLPRLLVILSFKELSGPALLAFAYSAVGFPGLRPFRLSGLSGLRLPYPEPSFT